MLQLVERTWRARWAHVVIANVRILLGFAFLPAGLKKVLGQRFTEVDNVGAFHDFLHAFYATGWFYQFVGVVQLAIAVLLMTQTFASLGAALALPVFATITAFCWSTAVYPTAIAVTFMLVGTIVLVVWDNDKYRPLVGAAAPVRQPSSDLIDDRLWRLCGAGILGLYLAICAVSGGIYRPKGVELDNPAFYTFPLIVLFPVVTLLIDQRRYRRRGKSVPAS